MIYGNPSASLYPRTIGCCRDNKAPRHRLQSQAAHIVARGGGLGLPQCPAVPENGEKRVEIAMTRQQFGWILASLPLQP